MLRRAELGVRRNPVWRDSSNVKRERAVRDGYGIEGMSSDSGILLGIILNFSHFLSDLKGLTIIFRCYGVNLIALEERQLCLLVFVFLMNGNEQPFRDCHICRC